MVFKYSVDYADWYGSGNVNGENCTDRGSICNPGGTE